MSSYTIEVTLWGVICKKHNLEHHSITNSFQIIAIKAGKVTNFNKISITTTFSSQIFIKPNIKETRDPRTWFEIPQTNIQCHSLSTHGVVGGHHSIQKNLFAIKNEDIGTGPEPAYILVKATISSMDIDNCWYVACQLYFKDRRCKKKLTPIEDGIWHCESCNQQVYECEYRYIFQFNIEYQTSKINATAFQDVAKHIIGILLKI